MGGAASQAEDARHAHDQRDQDSGSSDYSESDVEGPTHVYVKERNISAACRPDSAAASCRSCVPKLKFPLPTAEALTFAEPINDYEGESKPRKARKEGHYGRKAGETIESDVQSVHTRTTSGGWPTEYLDWLKQDAGLESGRKDAEETSREAQEAAAGSAAAARAELRAMSAENMARRNIECGGLGAPLLGCDGAKDISRAHGSNVKGKLFVFALFLMLLLWLGGGGHEVGQWYGQVEQAREKRAEAAEAAAQAAAEEREEERIEAEKIREKEAAAEKAAKERAAWMRTGGVPVALVVVGMLMVAVAVGYCA